jgi:general stress protein 26
MATKEEIRKIISDAQWGYLATSSPDGPRVRPISTSVDDDMVVWMATGTGDRKVQQVKASPQAEICYCTPTGSAHLRCSGPVEIVEDKAKREWFYNAQDYMAKFFSSPDDPKYTLLRLAPAKIEVMPEGKMEYEPYTP